MKVALACGGTGGHIFPGLATGEELRRRGHAVTLWLAGKDVEGAAVSGWDGPVVTVPAEGFPSGLSARAARTAWRLYRAVARCRKLMADDPPDALLAMGSYSSIGPATAAFKLGIPVVLHEANVIPGRAIAFLAQRADTVAASFEETRYYLRRKEIIITGLPLRRDLVAASRTPRPTRVPDEPFAVFVMGGSRGARRLNELVMEAVGEVHRTVRNLRVIHLAGMADEERVRAHYQALGVQHEVHGFSHAIDRFYREADLAVCRAGAATCAELQLFGVPSLLVPYPYAARGHQLANARTLEKNGAADVVEEKDLESGWLAEYLAGSYRWPERLARMRQAALDHARHHAATALCELVEQVTHATARSSIPVGV